MELSGSIISSGLQFCSYKLFKKYDLLFFIGNTNKRNTEKALTLDSAKIFFGSLPNLCFQIWLLNPIIYQKYDDYLVLGINYFPEDVKFTQYLSVVSNFIVKFLAAFRLLSYKEESENDVNDGKPENKPNLIEKGFKTGRNICNAIPEFLSWLPLILSSLLYKVFSLSLYIRFLGLYSLILIFVIFILNLIWSLFLSGISKSIVTRNRQVLINEKSSLMQKSFMSYSNIFIINRPFETLNARSLNAAILTQPVQHLVNLIFIPVYLHFSDGQVFKTYTTPSGYQMILFDQALLVLILTLVNMIFCISRLSTKEDGVKLPENPQAQFNSNSSRDSKKQNLLNEPGDFSEDEIEINMTKNMLLVVADESLTMRKFFNAQNIDL